MHLRKSTYIPTGKEIERGERVHLTRVEGVSDRHLPSQYDQQFHQVQLHQRYKVGEIKEIDQRLENELGNIRRRVQLMRGAPLTQSTHMLGATKMEPQKLKLSKVSDKLELSEKETRLVQQSDAKNRSSLLSMSSKECMKCNAFTHELRSKEELLKRQEEHLERSTLARQDLDQRFISLNRQNEELTTRLKDAESAVSHYRRQIQLQDFSPRGSQRELDLKNMYNEVETLKMILKSKDQQLYRLQSHLSGDGRARLMQQNEKLKQQLAKLRQGDPSLEQVKKRASEVQKRLTIQIEELKLFRQNLINENNSLRAKERYQRGEKQKMKTMFQQREEEAFSQTGSESGFGFNRARQSARKSEVFRSTVVQQVRSSGEIDQASDCSRSITQSTIYKKEKTIMNIDVEQYLGEKDLSSKEKHIRDFDLLFFKTLRSNHSSKKASPNFVNDSSMKSETSQSIELPLPKMLSSLSCPSEKIIELKTTNKYIENDRDLLQSLVKLKEEYRQLELRLGLAEAAGRDSAKWRSQLEGARRENELLSQRLAQRAREAADLSRRNPQSALAQVQRHLKSIAAGSVYSVMPERLVSYVVQKAVGDKLRVKAQKLEEHASLLQKFQHLVRKKDQVIDKLQQHQLISDKQHGWLQDEELYLDVKVELAQLTEQNSSLANSLLNAELQALTLEERVRSLEQHVGSLSGQLQDKEMASYYQLNRIEASDRDLRKLQVQIDSLISDNQRLKNQLREQTRRRVGLAYGGADKSAILAEKESYIEVLEKTEESNRASFDRLLEQHVAPDSHAQNCHKIIGELVSANRLLRAKVRQLRAFFHEFDFGRGLCADESSVREEDLLPFEDSLVLQFVEKDELSTLSRIEEKVDGLSQGTLRVLATEDELREEWRVALSALTAAGQERLPELVRLAP